MDLSLFFAGTAGSVPTPKRGLPALLLRAGGERILLDCGEGTQHQLLRSVGLPDIDAIFITHLHLDHWLGLPGMIKTFDMRDRERRLEIYGPPGLHALYNQALRPVIGRTGYPLEVVELEHHEEVRFPGFLIAGFPVKHRVEAFGYAFVEDDRPGRFDVETARALGIAEGPDFGRLQRGETVNGVRPEQVVGEDRPGRRIVYSGDTMPVQTVEVYAHDADLLVHEATFCDDERARARETGHSTARQAAQLARDANVKLLALTHLSTRYFPREVRDEARTVFENTVVPRDFDAIEIPFPERGEPELVGERGASPEPAGQHPTIK
jgi:ribonuclease Z